MQSGRVKETHAQGTHVRTTSRKYMPIFFCTLMNLYRFSSPSDGLILAKHATVECNVLILAEELKIYILLLLALTGL